MIFPFKGSTPKGGGKGFSKNHLKFQSSYPQIAGLRLSMHSLFNLKTSTFNQKVYNSNLSAKTPYLKG